MRIAAMYLENKPVVLGLIKWAKSPVSILNALYCQLISDGSIQKIESIPGEKKQALWNESSCWSKKADRIMYCRAKYVLDVL